MATVTIFTAERMQEIEDGAIVSAEVIDGEIIFYRKDETAINVGKDFGLALISDGNFEISDPTKGIILRSPDNTRWLIKVNNTGNLTTTALD
jgi:hypothetical protein